MPQKIVLVVGASSGLGSAAAQCLAADGHIVYAAARSFANGAEPPTGCRALALDVSAADSVHAAVDTVLREQGRVDALVCCAASFTMSPMEELPIDILADMMNVNFLGMARCVQAVMPAMRAQKSGHIVLFSSLNGLFSIPFQGAYSATKHAVEAYGEALAQETLGMGIHVTVVEPGDCRGGSQKYRRVYLNENSPYAAAFEHGTAKIHHDETNGLPPERVGHAVAKAVGKKNPPARLVVASRDQRSAIWMHKLLPRKLFNRIVAAYYR